MRFRGHLMRFRRTASSRARSLAEHSPEHAGAQYVNLAMMAAGTHLGAT